jgi:TolB-like protein/tetratricopeptide (TPR) repeat protein
MSFFEELKRRNVFRVAIGYVITAWLLLQVVDLVLENINTPDWVMQVFMLALAIGFPLAVFFAWAFEMTPEGVKLEKDVDRSQSMTRKTGQKMNRNIIIALGLVVVFLLFDRFVGSGSTSPEPVQTVENTDPGKSNLALAPAEKSIAVLPFANRSRLQDDEFFTDGIHDDLLTQLAKIKGLKVISRTSVMKFKDTQLTIPEIAKELGVSKIMEGGVQRAGNRIRINAQLIDVASDEHLWAETFDREMTVENIFDIQSEITRQIITAVRGELNAADTAVLGQLPTSSIEAYEAYLHARKDLNDPAYSPDRYIAAEEWLNQAVAYDPEFAQAWATLVTIHGGAVWLGFDEGPARFEAARKALENAEKFGPGLPETLAAKAEYLYRLKSDFHAAELLFEQASAAKPGDSDILTRLATAERRTGQFDESVTHFQMAIELDPENLEARSTLLGTLVIMRAFQRAELLADSWSRRFPGTTVFPATRAQVLISRDGNLAGAHTIFSQIEASNNLDFFAIGSTTLLYQRKYAELIELWSSDESVSYIARSGALVATSMAYRNLGNLAKAEEFSRMAIEQGEAYQSPNSNNMAWALDGLANSYANAGRYDDALQTAEKARQLKPESKDTMEGPYMSMTWTRMLALTGQRDAALVEIERLLDTPAGFNRWDLYLDPNWDFFRDDARFNALVRPDNPEERRQ